jgi:hypothetical protein
MTAHYTHISMQAERMAMQSMTHGKRPTPRPPERPPQAPPINMMDPVILAEIARQVALLVHQKREERYYGSTVKEQSGGPRLVVFPRKGHERA